MKQPYAAIIGFAVAPLVPVVGLGLFSLAAGQAKVSFDLMVMFLGVYTYAALVALFIGIPTLFIVRLVLRLKITRNVAIAGGFIDGILAGMIFLNTSQINGIFGFGLMGAASGVVFWLIWKRSYNCSVK